MRKLIKKGEKGLSLPPSSLSLTPGPFGYTSKPTLSFDTNYADNLKKSAQNVNNTISKATFSLKLSNDPEKRKLGSDMEVQNIKSEVDKSKENFKNTISQYKSSDSESTDDDKEPSKFSKIMHPKGMDIALQTAGAVADMLPSVDKTHNENDQLGENIRGTVEDALMKSGNPYAMAAGVASKIIGKTGGFTDGSKGLGSTNDTLNTIASFAIPGAGWFTKKTREIEKNEAVMSSSGYTGTANAIDTASQNAGAKILFGRGRAQRMIAEADMQQKQVASLLDKANIDRYASTNPLIGERIQMQMSGGYNPLVAKDGAKLYNIEFAKKALSLKKGGKTTRRNIIQLIQYAKQVNPRFIQRMNEPIKSIDLGDNKTGTHLLSWGTDDTGNAIVYPEIQEINGELKYFENPQEAYDNAVKNNNILIMTPEEAEDFTVNYKQGWPEFFRQFKNGGSFNVIPEGALHKNKHHLEDIDSKFEDVTSKGIPVISESEKGDITQHAEVEKEEIIFRLEVTKKLEELSKENTDDAALEAGKLLVTEILYNTVDKTNSML